MAAVSRKVVLVGLGDCGKTCLISALTEREFPKEYIPTVLDMHVANVELDGRLVELAIHDLNGLNEYERLRAHIYPGSHVILVCYSIDRSGSLDNVIETYLREFMTFCPGVPIVLAGCKKDLRNDPNARNWGGGSLVTLEQGQEVADKIGAHSFHECSALTNEGVNEVFEGVARAAIINVEPNNTGTRKRTLNPFVLRWKLGQSI